MNALPTDIVDRLWNADESDEVAPFDEDPESTQDAALQEYEQFAGANRAGLDEETKRRLDDARRLIRETMRKQKKDDSSADA
jgi:hypothetical protein